MRFSDNPCLSLLLSLFSFRSRSVSRALRSTPCLAREESSFHLASNNTRFYRSPLSDAFVLPTLPSVTPSCSLFSTHFFAFPLSSDSPPSRPLSRPFVISLQPSRVRFCFTDPLCHCLSFSVSNPRERLFSTSLFAPCLLSPTTALSHSIHHPLHMPCFRLSFSL